ncbi:MAG: DUF616 domain-containing protein [bacterium]|nr:DUF616 domain-containing protein [bacterium]
MARTVIYTAIFGDKDDLQEPAFKPANCDFICFTNRTDFTSPTWQLKTGEMFNNDPVRSARRYKILPHLWFPDYDYSVWIDGNIVVKGDVNELIAKYLSNANMAIYDHQLTIGDPRGSVYDEAAAILKMNELGKYKDNGEKIKAQMAGYRVENFPNETAGLISSMELVRRHNEEDVKTAMEAWWAEVRDQSRRDQLSFNYVAWKTGLKFNYLPGDSRANAYFRHLAHKTKHYYDSPKRVL